jgi:large subunit ribosomal protein L9e
MRLINKEIRLAVPAGCSVKHCKARKITIAGPRGELSRDFHHVPKLDLVFDAETKEIVATMWFASLKRSAALRTTVSHIKNLFSGVTKGFRYKMRAVYAHFPVNMNMEKGGTVVEIRNFLGEKRTRVCNMLPGVKCARDETVKDGLILEGNDIDNVSKSAALIHMACLVKNKDIRKFLDGIYVSERGTIETD